MFVMVVSVQFIMKTEHLNGVNVLFMIRNDGYSSWLSVGLTSRFPALYSCHAAISCHTVQHS
jgi:hypothetical protein